MSQEGQDDEDAWTPENDRTMLKVMPIVLVVALALFGGGTYFAEFQARLVMDGESASGVVIDLERGSSTSSGSSRPTWFPIVRFETPDGQSVTFRHRTGQSPPAYEKGDGVPVIYLPDAPDQALIEEGFWNWLLPVLLLVVGAGLIVISVRSIIGSRRRLAAMR